VHSQRVTDVWPDLQQHLLRQRALGEESGYE
jgi:hypothetical protein